MNSAAKLLLAGTALAVGIALEGWADTLQEWFDANAYTINVATDELGIEKFEPGERKVTVLNGYHAYLNPTGWYVTDEAHLLFEFPEVGDTASFVAEEEFGFFIVDPLDRVFYTETALNGDGVDHALVFENTKGPGYIVAFEDWWGGGDWDYTDRIILVTSPELVFRAPYALGAPFGSSSSFPPLLTKAESKSEVQPDQGLGYTYVDVIASLAGEGDAVAGFTLEEWWISDRSGTANIAATFNTTGSLKAIGASLGPFGYSILGLGFKAGLTVHDVTTSQNILYEEKLIFEEEMKWDWMDLVWPLTYSSPTYENTEFLIQGFIEIEEGHTYLWRFETRVWTLIVTAGLGTGFTMADIETELVDVRVGPPVLKPEPEPITTTGTDMLVAVFSPINILVIDPEGRRIGFDFNTQQEVNEIPGAWYGGPEYVPQLVRIPTPIAGDYEVLLSGISTGSYTALIVGTGDLTGGEVFTGDIVEGAIYAYTMTITDTAVTSQPNPTNELGYFKDYILGLPAEVFKGKADNRKNALSNKIDEVILKVEASQYVDATNKLLHDIRAKMDDDSTAEDWIIDPATQLDLCVIIDHIILNIEMLQEENG